MFRSALAPRNKGSSILKPCGAWLAPADGADARDEAQPSCVNRMKMKIVAKNQNVRFTRCRPMMPSRKSYRLSTSHSQKFCAPAGTRCILRVATWANTIRPTATIQVTTIELVIGSRPSLFSTGTAACGNPCSSLAACDSIFETSFWRSASSGATPLCAWTVTRVSAPAAIQLPRATQTAAKRGKPSSTVLGICFIVYRVCSQHGSGFSRCLG